ncbi:hypothetical protein Ahy_B04g069445 [Arachis hypogaea]|uniref:Aminotransferase-like plant mobile domain-containing protein n=1 Tax=Arachis hypogaea TaxID=3818 RepID=A0A444ZCN4_ARAHY|nr:hypothetical protein Ahy_B04g069445 [Arachis hypogaea]
MARVDVHDPNINRLNETWHYAGVADFAASPFPAPTSESYHSSTGRHIVPYLREAGFGDTVPLRDFTFDNSLIMGPETHMFHLPWGEATITLQDVAYHLGLRAHGDPVGECFCDFYRWYCTETWELVERLLGARPPVVPQQATQRNESFSPKLVWLRDRVRQMPPTDDLETLRQYARCYILLLICVGCHCFRTLGGAGRCLGVRLCWLGRTSHCAQQYTETSRTSLALCRTAPCRTGMLIDGLDCINSKMTLQMRPLSNCR